MSINDKNNGRGKIVMLALMMVTSTFAAIGTTAADPTGMETVMWDAENGEMYTHEDGELVYEYEYPEDALYDFKFISDGLDIGDTYSILIVLVDVAHNMDVYEIGMEWQATDYDGDGVADNSSEFLVGGEHVDMIHNDTCYDAEAMLFYDANDGSAPEEVVHISQLIGFGDYECNWGDGDYDEHLTMEFRGANYDNPQPKYEDHSETNIVLIPNNLHEPMNWCENTTTGEEVDADEVDCEADPNTMWIEEDLTYDIHYWLAAHETGEVVEVMFETVVDGDEYDVDVSANGCYDLYAELYLNLTQTADGQTEDYYEPVSDSMEGFSVGKDCFTAPTDPPVVWSKADREFNPDMDMFDYYGEGDSIVIEYGAWNLEPETTYTSMLLILGPFSPDGEHHEGPSFICGDGTEIPFEYVNDLEEDCPDGADEQQYNDDGTKLNWFDCHDGTQIWIDQVNDGEEDCAHGEDEAGDHHDDGHGEEPHTDDGSEDGSLDGDNGTEHDDGDSEEFCYDMDNDVVTEHDNQEDCEYAGFMWVKEDGEEHDGPETALEVMMDYETSLEGDFFTDYIIEPGVLEDGFYASMHVVIYDFQSPDAQHFPQEEEPSLFCVGESTCEFGPGEMDPWEYTTGHGYYQMHFDQFENHESPDGNSFNGILELTSVETIDSSYRMYADADGDGNVDPMEAMMFLSMMAENMHDEGPDEECPFDKDHPDSPCNVEACSPEGYTEDGCHEAIEEYCALVPDPACDGMADECPFWKDEPDSPCNVEACGPDGDDAACWDAVMTYCENYPEDPGCDELDDMEECPFDMDNPDSPCNYDPCDPMSEEHNESACHSKVEAYCADNPEDEGCHHDEHDDGTEGDDDGTGASSADGRHCVPEGEACDDDHDHGVEDGDDDNDDESEMVVTLDGTVLGDSTFEWIWIDGLVGPVDGSDGMPVTIISGQVWELSLEDWKTTEMHVVELSSSDADRPLVTSCNEDGVRGHGDVGHGVFAVYDSWAWSPEEPELEGDGWMVEADGEHGWISPFNCADQGELQTLTVTFSKTIRDYNADNLEAEEAGPGADWEQDVEDNQAPTCHVFASTTNDGTNWEESEDHFEAPDGDKTIFLTPGVWFLSVYCEDPDGDMVMGHVTANGETIEFLEEGEGHAFAEFPVMAGMPNLTVEYKWDSTGGHSGAGTITLVVEIIEDNTNNTGDSVEPITNDDGTVACPPGSGLVLNADNTECVAPAVDNVGDIIEEVAADEGGSIPGFTTALSVISMLGAVLVMSRRKQDC